MSPQLHAAERIEETIKRESEKRRTAGPINETILIPRNGNEIPVDVNISYIKDEKDHVNYVVLVSHCISLRKKENSF